MAYLIALGGVVLLFGGGEFLVRGAVSVSRRFGISPLLIGMTIVAACTSAPELVVSFGAALEGKSDMALGNIVGSNIFNILGVLGVSALISPIIVKPRELRRDTAVMLSAAIALVAATQMGIIGRPAGLIFLAAMVAYVYLSYRSEMRGKDPGGAELHTHEAEEVVAPESVGLGLAYLAGGLAALVVGSRLLIIGATEIALALGVSEAVIALTLVSVGTSLPELATSMVAAARGHSDVAVGNVVGSNIFNVLGIIGVTALARPIAVIGQIAHFDVWLMLAVSVGLAPLLLMSGRIGRVAGIGFVSAYAMYVVRLFGA